MNGILYVAIGEEHYQEALISAASAKCTMGDLDICLVSNRYSVDHSLFNEHLYIDIDEYDPGMKIKAVGMSPYTKTLFLDTDTYLLAPMLDVFDVLDHFDIAAVFQGNRENWATFEQVPILFPEVNSGVLAFKKCEAIDNLFTEWKCRYDETVARGDQGALREALYYSKVRLCILPPECNFRLSKEAMVGSIVRVLHGKRNGKEAFERVRRYVNARGDQRVLRPVEFLS